MRLNLRMIDRSDYTIAGVATFFGLCVQQALAAWIALPMSIQTFLQGLITLTLGLAAVVAQHFLRRYLKRNFPDEAPPQNGLLPQGAATGRARYDWLGPVRRVARPMFDFIRGVISRLRRRKES
ncbi:MAG TPA: hypothetical protein VFV58_18545 [Blastocatellia bacterium]|nr:hypothetical protein [Blastocatellia bacterium]